MEEMFEYLVPLQGLFKKRRDLKIIESYKQLEEFNEIVEDFKTAEEYLDDSIRVGHSYIFCKEKITIFFIKDIVQVSFRVHGSDPSDEYGTIDFLFRDGSEKVVYKTSEIDSEKVASAIFSALDHRGIKTAVIKTR